LGTLKCDALVCGLYQERFKAQNAANIVQCVYPEYGGGELPEPNIAGLRGPTSKERGTKDILF